jgi:hypothetical protein
MPRSKQKIGSELQPALFDLEPDPLPGSYDLDHQVRTILSDACRQQRLSRAEIAQQMSRLLGRSVTERILNDFTADSHELHRFPLAWTAAFCHVTNDFRLLDVIVRRLGAQLINSEQARLLDLGRATVVKESTDREYQARLYYATRGQGE